MEPDDEDTEPATGRPKALFAFILLLILADLVADVRGGTPLAHMAMEIAAGTLALLGVASMGGQLQRERVRAGALAADLERARAEAHQWAEGARDTLTSLGSAVDGQFDRWALTEAERHVALLLLKGLRLKEIAAERGTSERTVRQQALTVYRKAGVDGRTALAGFFLDSLHAPPRDAAAS
jgi:DNA-binding CsgD family transcriptional regulator